jgi:hypothetical protein
LDGGVVAVSAWRLGVVELAGWSPLGYAVGDVTGPGALAVLAVHLVTAERLLAEVPLVKRGERDRHVRVALVHAVLTIAAGIIHPGDRNTAA